MPSFQEALQSLIANSKEALTAERLAAYSAVAEQLAALDVPPPAPAPVVKPDPAVAARAKLAELNATPLPPGATDRQKIARAEEQAAALRVLHPHLAGSDNLEAFDFPGLLGNGGEAA